jgi:hypothetical protein
MVNMKKKKTSKPLKDSMGTIERRITSFKRASYFFNIPLTLLFDHPNGKTWSIKINLISVFLEEDEDVVD